MTTQIKSAEIRKVLSLVEKVFPGAHVTWVRKGRGHEWERFEAKGAT